MLNRDIIVVGASSGGLEALQALVGGLPADLPAAVFVVWHLDPNSPSQLPTLLSRAGPLPAVTAQDGDPIVPGRIYVAPPDRHLLIAAGRMRVTYGPKENRARPAVDALFRSAAVAYGPRVIGVVLSGQLDDGTAGLWAVKDCGGLALIQDPVEASFPSMPRTAQQYVDIDYRLPMAQMGPTLARLAGSPVAPEGAFRVNADLEIETRIAQNESALEMGVMKLGTPSPYSCPACNGVLLQLKTNDILRFRCHTGHAYSAQSLLADIDEAVERELWGAVRTIEESVLLMRQMARDGREAQDNQAAELFDHQAEAALRRVATIRQALVAQVRVDPQNGQPSDPPQKRRRGTSGKANGKTAPASRKLTRRPRTPARSTVR